MLCDDQESFHRAKSWVKELQRQGSPDVVIALAGNKIDRDEEREVGAADAKQYADDNSLYFIETSAKTNVNVRELFLAIARQLPKVCTLGMGRHCHDVLTMEMAVRICALCPLCWL